MANRKSYLNTPENMTVYMSKVLARDLRNYAASAMRYSAQSTTSKDRSGQCRCITADLSIGQFSKNAAR